MSFADYLEGKLLDEVFGGTAFTPGTGTIYVGVSTTNPGEAGTSITEPGGAEYDRVAVVNNGTNWNAASAGTKSNAVAFTFTTATSDWGTVAHFFIADDPTATANILAYGTLDTAKAVTTNDVFRFSAGSLKITLT